MEPAQRALVDARRATGFMPKYDAKKPWRTFEIEWINWYRIHDIAHAGDDDFRKTCMIAAMIGNAAEMAKPIGPDSAIFRDSNPIQFLEQLRQIFEPPAESK